MTPNPHPRTRRSRPPTPAPGSPAYYLGRSAPRWKRALSPKT